MRACAERFRVGPDRDAARAARLDNIRDDVGYHQDLGRAAGLDVPAPILATAHTYPDTFTVANLLAKDRREVGDRLVQVVAEHERITEAITAAHEAIAARPPRRARRPRRWASSRRPSAGTSRAR